MMTVVQSKTRNLGVLMIAFSPVVREGLQAIMNKDEGIEVIGDVATGHEAIQRIRQAKLQGRPVNVVLTETRSGDVDGVQATRLIKDEFPGVSVLVLTENLNDSYVIDAIHAGASGYIFLKDMTPKVLLQSIHQAVEGGTQMTTELLRAAVENLIQNGRKTLAERTAEAAHLTAREVDVLRLMGNGDPNKVIGAKLGITLDTTKKHVRNVIDKLQARSRTHASIIAAQAGLVGKPVNGIIAEAKTIDF
ncbi:MAG: response regulator transcription factor [Dehalococcoidaceae bacterium]|nr:response regulator transcription factor [Dehalococcoidaceae bacterium]